MREREKQRLSFALISLFQSTKNSTLHSTPNLLLPRRVQPVLEHVVRVGAQLAPRATAAGLHVRAGNPGVPDPGVARVAAAGFFSGVGERARGPVVDEALGTGEDLVDFFKFVFHDG